MAGDDCYFVRAIDSQVGIYEDENVRYRFRKR